MATHLFQLKEVERLSPGCIRILGGNPGKFTLQGTNTYLLGTGSKRLLIDTGEGKPSWIAAIKRTLDEERASVESAIVTHWHPDHVGGIKDLLRLSPLMKIFKNQASDGQQEIEDGQEFKVDGASLRALHTPGHTTDHMVFIFEEEDAMFTGDNVLGQGTAVFEDLSVYLQSLETMKSRFGGRGYPGHGPVIEDGPRMIAEYIRHRAEREEQVLRCLRSHKAVGATPQGNAYTAMELVKIIYSDVREDLHPAAERGVLQILSKLKREGRVTQEDASWRLELRPSI